MITPLSQTKVNFINSQAQILSRNEMIFINGWINIWKENIMNQLRIARPYLLFDLYLIFITWSFLFDLSYLFLSCLLIFKFIVGSINGFKIVFASVNIPEWSVFKKRKIPNSAWLSTFSPNKNGGTLDQI